jgi:hypothetical protein
MKKIWLVNIVFNADYSFLVDAFVALGGSADTSGVI